MRRHYNSARNRLLQGFEWISLIVLIVSVALFTSVTNSAAQAQPKSPVQRTSHYDLVRRVIQPYPEVKAQAQTPAPSNASLIFETVGLTIDKPSQARTFAIEQGEDFLLLNGASQSEAIGVKYRVTLPNGTIYEYSTNAKQPFYFFIKRPPAGNYKVELTTITPGNTTALIQATSLNKGVALVDKIEKEHLHLEAGRAKYFKFTKQQQEWISFHISKIAGEDILITLIRLPDLSNVTAPARNSFSQFYTPIDLPEGQYLLAITNLGPTDVSIILAKPRATVNLLGLNEGKLATFQIPSDQQFFYLNLNKSISWLAFEGALASIMGSGGEGRYVLYGPDWKKIFDSVSRGVQELLGYFVKSPRLGSYLLVVTGKGFPGLTLKFTSEEGVEDLTRSPKSSMQLVFTQSGQSVYYRVNGTRQLIELVAPLQRNLVSFTLIDPKLQFVADQLIDQPSLYASKGGESFYYLALQGQNGTVMLHHRARGQEDGTVTSPDYSDFNSRLTGDAIFLNVTLKSPRYIMQYYVSLEQAGEPANRVWILTEEPRIMTDIRLQQGEGVFNIWRVGHELSYTPRGNWLMVILSNSVGPTVRVSTLQTGDEEVKDLPYHSFLSPQFDGQLKVLKVNVPKSRWLVAISFTDVNSKATILFYDPKLDLVASHSYSNEKDLRGNILSNPLEGPWLVPFFGPRSYNVSLAIVSHLNLLDNITGLVRTIFPANMSQLQQMVDQLNAKVNELNTTLASLQEENKRLTDQVHLLESQVQAKNQQIQELEELIETLRGISGQAPRQGRLQYLFPYTLDELVLFAFVIPLRTILVPIFSWIGIGFIIGFALKRMPRLTAFLLMSGLVLVIYLQMGASVLETALGYLRLVPLYIIPCLIGVRIGSFARRRLVKQN